MSIFSDLLDFIQHRMRMAHIYQPVMLTTLIKGGGTASVAEIASQFAQRDNHHGFDFPLPKTGEPARRHAYLCLNYSILTM